VEVRLKSRVRAARAIIRCSETRCSTRHM